LRPSEKKLLERRSGTFRHKNTPALTICTDEVWYLQVAKNAYKIKNNSKNRYFSEVKNLTLFLSVVIFLKQFVLTNVTTEGIFIYRYLKHTL
jgi:hypothetical protein